MQHDAVAQVLIAFWLNGAKRWWQHLSKLCTVTAPISTHQCWLNRVVTQKVLSIYTAFISTVSFFASVQKTYICSKFVKKAADFFFIHASLINNCQEWVSMLISWLQPILSLSERNALCPEDALLQVHYNLLSWNDGWSSCWASISTTTSSSLKIICSRGEHTTNRPVRKWPSLLIHTAPCFGWWNQKLQRHATHRLRTS